jgi:hypothetical protein
MGGNKLKLLEYQDMAFRWTCCGFTAAMGTRRLEMSRSKLFGIESCSNILVTSFLKQAFVAVITTAIQKLHCHAAATFVKWANLFLTNSSVSTDSQSRQGLTLHTGPDPRSRNPMAGGIAEMMRGVYGMDE